MIQYKKRRNYKYNLHSDCVYDTKLTTLQPKQLKFIDFSDNGILTIKKGYSWDGPSGPAIDTKTFMRGSLIHDALYQLMREQVLPQKSREPADEILKTVCLEDGMSRFRAWYVYKAVRIFGASSAAPDILQAP